MPVIKNALLRYRVLDRCIRNEYQPYPSKEELRQACEEELFGSTTGNNICHSTIEKDIFAMRMEHDAPIIYSRKERGYYYTDSSFSMDDIPLTDADISAIKAATSILNQFKNTQLFSQFQYAIDKILDRVNLSANNHHNFNDDILHFETQPTVVGNEYLEPILNAIKQQQPNHAKNNTKNTTLCVQTYVPPQNNIVYTATLKRQRPKYPNRNVGIDFDIIAESFGRSYFFPKTFFCVENI